MKQDNFVKLLGLEKRRPRPDIMGKLREQFIPQEKTINHLIRKQGLQALLQESFFPDFSSSPFARYPSVEVPFDLAAFRQEKLVREIPQTVNSLFAAPDCFDDAAQIETSLGKLFFYSSELGFNIDHLLAKGKVDTNPQSLLTLYQAYLSQELMQCLVSHDKEGLLMRMAQGGFSEEKVIKTFLENDFFFKVRSDPFVL